MLELILLERNSIEKQVAKWSKNDHFATPRNHTCFYEGTHHAQCVLIKNKLREQNSRNPNCLGQKGFRGRWIFGMKLRRKYPPDWSFFDHGPSLHMKFFGRARTISAVMYKKCTLTIPTVDQNWFRDPCDSPTQLTPCTYSTQLNSAHATQNSSKLYTPIHRWHPIHCRTLPLNLPISRLKFNSPLMIFHCVQ